MTVAANYSTQLTTVETPTVGVPAIASNQTITQNQFNTTLNLSAGSTPPVSASSKEQLTMASGAIAIDLTNLVALGGAVLNCNGSRVRMAKFKSPKTNSNPMTVSVAGSNGYTGFGANFNCTIPVGGEVTYYDGGAGGAVNSTNKALAIAGTGNTDVCQVEIVIGT